jgi:hypothetical protein
LTSRSAFGHGVYSPFVAIFLRRHGQRGVNSRVLELFKLTEVDTLIPITGTLEDAEVLARSPSNCRFRNFPNGNEA